MDQLLARVLARQLEYNDSLGWDSKIKNHRFFDFFKDVSVPLITKTLDAIQTKEIAVFDFDPPSVKYQFAARLCMSDNLDLITALKSAELAAEIDKFVLLEMSYNARTVAAFADEVAPQTRIEEIIDILRQKSHTDPDWIVVPARASEFLDYKTEEGEQLLGMRRIGTIENMTLYEHPFDDISCLVGSKKINKVKVGTLLMPKVLHANTAGLAAELSFLDIGDHVARIYIL